MRIVNRVRRQFIQEYRLTTLRQKRLLTKRFIVQLIRCKDDAARRLLLGVSR